MFLIHHERKAIRVLLYSWADVQGEKNVGNDGTVLAQITFCFVFLSSTEHVQLQPTEDYRAHRHSQSGVETAADSASAHHDPRELITWNKRG